MHGLTPFTNYSVSVRGVNSAEGGGYSREAVIRTGEDSEFILLDFLAKY